MLKKTSMAALGVVASSFLSLFVSCNRSPETTVRQRGELVVAMDAEMPGYFVLGGESYGYQYDLFKAYADYLGVRLRIVDGDRAGWPDGSGAGCGGYRYDPCDPCLR